MNYFDARERNGGGFHYTCRNDDRIWPVGYDSPFRSCPTCKGHSAHKVNNQEGEENWCPKCKSQGYIGVDPHPPHATKEEAYECATQWVLDTANWDRKVDTSHSVPRCEKTYCETLVEDGGAVEWGFGIGALTILCLEHRNRETLAEIVGRVGQVISS